PHLHDRRGSESAAQARGQVRKLRPAFFFSSRRRHTRLQGDWSSDVCSSDLAVHDPDALAGLSSMVAQMLDEGTKTRTSTQIAQQIEFIGGEMAFAGTEDFTTGTLRVLRKDEIGRASCRERV